MPNTFLFYGNDEFAISQKIKEFESKFPDATTAGMNIARLDARTVSDDELNNAVNAMPFLAPNRLVILANPSAKYKDAAARKKFEEFLGAAPDTSMLVLTEFLEYKEAEKHWLVKWAGKNAARVKTQAFFLPRQRDIAAWIVTETKKQGGAIDSHAAAQLADMVGVDTRRAAMEIAKVLAYVDWARPIQGSDVEAVCVVSSEQSVFDFVDALSLGNAKSAQHLLHRLLETEDPAALWAMVVRQFRIVLQAREILDGRGGKDDVARALGVHPFVAEKACAQARHYSIDALEQIYRRLLAIDERFKTGQIALDLALDSLVIELQR